MDDLRPATREKALLDLEWQRIAAAVAARCVGPRSRATDVPIATTEEGTRTALGETAEAIALLTAGEPIPLDGIRDVRQHLERVDREGVLDGPALNDVRATLGAARVLRKFLGARRGRAPKLADACSTDPTLDRLEEEIGAAIEPDGTVSDAASPEIRRLRTEVANVRGRLVGRLEEMVHKHADVLSDRYYTIREGRYVLPVRRDAHERIQGIVHGTSSSGATVFVEPRGLVEPGNRLKMAQSELEREEARILALVSDLVRERIAEVRAAVDALDHADLRSASAKLGRDLGAILVELDPEQIVKVREGRHPILLLDGAKVVPNDVELEAGHALIVSGPNAGGKTVALKMVGLTALMVRAGLPVPCAEGTRCGFFDPVLTDVGDEQSITKNLSTFSAHVTNLTRILSLAGRRALVLLDELATGTDPAEGAALACAVVDALCKKGAAVAVTTHYEPLKALATNDDRMRNASVGFDVQAMAPTFELRLDVPGASSALAVAARFGIPSDVIETARRILPEQAKSFDELVRKLEDRRQALEIERSRLAEEREQAERARSVLERELAEIRRREREKLGTEAFKLMEELRRARAQVRDARRALKKGTGEEAIREASRIVEEASRVSTPARDAAAAPAAEEEPGTPVDVSTLGAGDRVWVPRLRAEASILEGPVKGRVRVAAGAMKLWVDIEGLRTLGAEAKPAAPPPSPAPAALASEREPSPASPALDRLPPPSTDNTLDVRGLRVDEAIALAETFVDRLYGASEPVGYVVHGIGSGALRDALRTHLRDQSRYVRDVRSGSPEEGGDRVTVVVLR